METKLYDVVIIDRVTRTIDAVIGTNMRGYDGTGSGRNTAEMRRETGLSRVNDAYTVKIVAAGKYKKGDVIP